MTSSAPPAPGRRSSERGRRLNATILLAVLLPVLCAAAILLVRPGEAAEVDHPPTRTALTRATVVCPSAMEGAPALAVTSAAGDGSVAVGLGGDTARARVTRDRVSAVTTDAGPVAVTGEDEVAPGLVAARFAEREPAAATCPPPAAHAWFTGVGSGAGHTSVLELVNPDAGTAVADITVRTHAGVLDAPRLRGVSVPGSSSVRLDLASIVPRRDELTLEVTASRGRIGSTVLDRYDQVGGAPSTSDWLPAQAEPATENLLMGLAPGAGTRTLVVANGTDDELRADVRIVSADSVFAPRGVPEIRVPPQSVRRVSVSDVVGSAVQKGATGLLVTATGPVTASLRSYVAGDLSHAVPGDALTGTSTVLLPPGGPGVTKTVQLAGAPRTGAVSVVARSASGQQLASTRADIGPDRGTSVDLPAGTALLTIRVERTSVSGAVLVTGGGAAVVPLRVPVTNGLVPAVRPGLP